MAESERSGRYKGVSFSGNYEVDLHLQGKITSDVVLHLYLSSDPEGFDPGALQWKTKYHQGLLFCLTGEKFRFCIFI
jgi:hypothetical protein